MPTPIFQSLTSYPPTPTTAAVTSSTGAVWAYPSGIQAGDALVLCAVNNNPNGGSGASGTTFTTPTGWTAKESNPGINTDVSCYLYVKIAAGTESGTNITLKPSATGLVAAGLLRYSGNDHVTAFGDTAANPSSSVNGTAPAAGTLSPAPGVDDMVVRMYGWGQDSSGTGSASTVGSGWSATRLNNFTNVSSSFQCGVSIIEKVAGTSAVTVTNVTSGWLVADVVIKAGPGSFMPFFL